MRGSVEAYRAQGLGSMRVPEGLKGCGIFGLSFWGVGLWQASKPQVLPVGIFSFVGRAAEMPGLRSPEA